MIAVLVNCAAIIIGSVIGLLCAKKMTAALSDIIQTGAGIVVTIIGLQMTFKYQSIVYLTLSLIGGGLLGTWLNIDGQILRLGCFLQRLVYRGRSQPDDKGDGNFAYAFLNASVLFCVGAMAIIGSFKAAVEKDYTIIFTKSILDGFMAITFAASMGAGTVFSFVAVFIYQGSLTLLSYLIKPYVTDALIAELTGCGGALIVMIGINLLGLRKIRTANYLPALLLEIVFVLGESFVRNIAHF
jgi:uncharacterized protein